MLEREDKSPMVRVGVHKHKFREIFLMGVIDTSSLLPFSLLGPAYS